MVTTSIIVVIISIISSVGRRVELDAGDWTTLVELLHTDLPISQSINT